LLYLQQLIKHIVIIFAQKQPDSRTVNKQHGQTARQQQIVALTTAQINLINMTESQLTLGIAKIWKVQTVYLLSEMLVTSAITGK